MAPSPARAVGEQAPLALPADDPEVSYADRELDLAYMHASASLPAAFWATYEHAWPLEPGYAHRRPALQLHHLLLQVRHFGPERYRPRIEAVLDHYSW